MADVVADLPSGVGAGVEIRELPRFSVEPNRPEVVVASRRAAIYVDDLLPAGPDQVARPKEVVPPAFRRRSFFHGVEVADSNFAGVRHFNLKRTRRIVKLPH